MVLLRTGYLKVNLADFSFFTNLLLNWSPGLFRGDFLQDLSSPTRLKGSRGQVWPKSDPTFLLLVFFSSHLAFRYPEGVTAMSESQTSKA